MRAKIIPIVLAYVVVLAASVYAYHSYPQYRQQIKFWIPQLFLLVMIVVTTLYVVLTADLVEETRRLQQRPMIQLSFREISEEPKLKMNDLFGPAQECLQGLVAKIVGANSCRSNHDS